MSRPRVVVATDPKGDFSYKEIVALRGEVNSILNTIPISSSATGFQVNWKAPNEKSLVSRKMRIKGTLSFQFNWTPNATTSIIRVAPRQYAFHQLASTWQFWVNNQGMGGQSFGEFAVPVMKYMGDMIESNTIGSATLGDYWTEYSNATGRSVTNVIGDSVDCEKGRAGWSGFSVTNTKGTTAGTSQTSVVTINFDEPFLFGGCFSLLKDAPALTNVSILQWAVNYSSNLQRLISVAFTDSSTLGASSTFSPSGSGLLTNASILVESFDPSPFMKLPERAFYPVDRYDFQQSPTITGCSGSTAIASPFVSPVITCPAVPSRMYCFVKPSQLSYSATDSDFLALITSLQVTFDSKPLLTTYDLNGLYQLSLNNGFKSVFNDRAYALGYANIINSNGVPSKAGVTSAGLCLVFGKDIVLPDGVVTGSQGQHTIQVIAQATNQSTTTYSLALDVVLVYDEILEVSQSTALVMPVNVTVAESVQEGERVPSQELTHGVAGGGLVYGRKTGFGGSKSGGTHGGTHGGSHGGSSRKSLKSRLRR